MVNTKITKAQLNHFHLKIDNNHMEYFDTSYSLYTVHDAVHGTIDFKSLEGSLGIGTVVKFLNTKIIQRLRNVKQLGYASHSHPAADHSRYAHAIGTMYIMSGLLERFRKTSPERFKKIIDTTSKIFPKIKTPHEGSIIKHMLLAGLLQDIGELPYGQATESVFRPHEDVIKSVKDLVGSHNNDWSKKDIFTTFAIFKDIELAKLLSSAKIDSHFLVYLITGHFNDDLKSIPTSLSTLRQLVDGSVDADRLDYVYRDGHHAVGGMGNPSSVIESLIYYDEQGPVFSDPGPISEFIIKRAHLWRTVYFSPVNRFRVVLLKTFLKGLMENDTLRNKFFIEGEKDGLSYEAFKKLEDISLTERLIKFHEENSVNNQRIKNALDLLLTQSPEFTCFWLPQQNTSSNYNGNLSLPDYFFYDTFPNYNSNISNERKTLNSIRIQDDKFKYLNKKPIDISQCTGGLLSVAENGFSAVPIKNGILLFEPKDKRNKIGVIWNNIDKLLKNNSLYHELIIQDIKSDLNAPADTLNKTGFTGKKVFISYAFEDFWLVKKIVQTLYAKKRRYIAIIDPFQGLGGTPNKNSIEAANKAERFLIIASKSWVKKHKENPNGPIATEMVEIVKKIDSKKKKYPACVLSVNNYKEIENEFPYLRLGHNTFPYTGKALESASYLEIKDAIEEFIKTID